MLSSVILSSHRYKIPLYPFCLTPRQKRLRRYFQTEKIERGSVYILCIEPRYTSRYTNEVRTVKRLKTKFKFQVFYKKGAAESRKRTITPETGIQG
jgi:hypothetical protein